ncbi:MULTISPECIES: SDR family NAD(P)-dependent oxidoreductase [unclassified Haematobacter]|uniref:SDR family NAD(P)-dependent oxidoreductase n=1 Tax=unclassified Haematobacter TaxID=2640585 RepID=UPI0025C09E3F|nr:MULTISPECIES: SDR family NAD(P)-dependent oxidoreductase [unclassified Haematobacter]
MTRSILITGCSSGIGLDAARRLHTLGWRVFATCRKAEDCARLEAEGLESLPLDLASEDSVAQAVSEVLARTGGGLDALVNNGAFACPGAVEDLPRGALREVMEVNLIGTHDLTRQVIRAMRRQGHGRIVTVSSILGVVPAPWRGAYVASKFALEGLTDTLRLELSDTPIRVSLVEPGPIATQFRVNAKLHFERWIDWEASARREQYRTSLLERLYGTPEKDRWELPPSAVTRVILRALESRSPRLRYTVTTPALLGVTLKRLLPDRAMDALLRRQ